MNLTSVLTRKMKFQRKTKITSDMIVLSGARDWKVIVDLRTPLKFPSFR